MLPQLFFMFLLIIAGAGIHPDPLIGSFIILGWIMMFLVPLCIYLHFANKKLMEKIREQIDKELKEKYPDAKPLHELYKDYKIDTTNKGE